MPRKNPALRDYPMSDGDLIQIADDLVIFRERDAAEFATRNIDDTAAMEAARAAFLAMPADSVFKGLVEEEVAKKDAARDALKDAVADLRSRAEAAHENNPGLYDAYGFEGFSELGDAEMHRQAVTIAYMAGEADDALLAHGHTPALQTALLTKIAALDTAINAVNKAQAVRDRKTAERIALGNALFKEVTRISKAGQALFRNTDEARYNDYVLDPAGNGNNQPDPVPDGGGTDE